MKKERIGRMEGMERSYLKVRRKPAGRGGRWKEAGVYTQMEPGVA